MQLGSHKPLAQVHPKAVSAQNKVELDKLHPVAVDALGLIFTQLASSHLHVRDEPGHVAQTRRNEIKVFRIHQNQHSPRGQTPKCEQATPE